MNVYDFDKTIYKDDSSIDFYKFNLRRYPKLIKYWPKQVKAMVDCKKGLISKTEMKTIFYRYFRDIKDIEQSVTLFWETHHHKLQTWYLDQRLHDDIIISASPEFLLKPICDSLNVTLIGSIVNPLTGENLVENCYGDEKVKRFREVFNLNDIDAFYSDSYSDDPLAQYAKTAFMVKGETLQPW